MIELEEIKSAIKQIVESGADLKDIVCFHFWYSSWTDPDKCLLKDSEG